MVVEEKGSSKPTLAEDKGKGPAKIEEAKKSTEDDTPLAEGPFDQDLGGRRYRVHHATGKVMGANQPSEAIGFAEQLGYPSGSTIFGAVQTIIVLLPRKYGNWSMPLYGGQYWVSEAGSHALKHVLRGLFWLLCLHISQGNLCLFLLFSFGMTWWNNLLIFLFSCLTGFGPEQGPEKNVVGEATQKEIMLRSEVSQLRIYLWWEGKSFKILEKDFIESWTEAQAMHEEKSKLKETMGRKISELEASIVEKDNQIASLEAELKRAKEEQEVEITKMK
jgi:hypothetical protein